MFATYSAHNSSAPAVSTNAVSITPDPEIYSASLLPIHGQHQADALLKTYLDSPDSRAFLFHGPTGTGKTTSAHFLCDHLGVDRSPMGGFDELASGDQTADAVRQLSRSLRLRPMSGFWRLLIVNEADKMTAGAEIQWMDILDDVDKQKIPNLTIVFTTNNPEKLTQRFRTRCDEIEFLAEESAVRSFARQEWMRLAPGRPIPASLHTAGIREGWSPSYRLALKDIRQALALHSR